MYIYINRPYTLRQNLGDMDVIGDDNDKVMRLFSMELEWNDNKRNESCIPRGTYKVKRRTSEKYGDHFIFEDVPDRSYILMHTGNFYNDLQGCLSPGLTKVHINNDNVKDVGYSGNAMEILLSIMPEEFDVVID